ncbi:O-antigen ligase family protein [Oscillatoria sp. FACHB-1406]|uniref:O-antigen ligase family protein n=1 Tax=Oscillatoria sp. FACHB-1406 TaxID=2692846 RepID=UPI0016874A16|nr:O-antigen ligase family protein [Oscillatoria sp. FACHB-1406]MBD2577186.1 O-antigen ligase family protein [Oscillatoria sp. FACHB-1406]
MKAQRVQLYYVALTIGLAAITIVYLLVPVYPAYTLPVTPDLFGVAVVSALLATAWKIGKPLTLPFVLRRSELIVIGLIWFNLLILIAPRAFLSLFKTPGQQWIPCKIIPGFAPKLECLMQAAVNQHYGIRNFFIFFTGVILATLVFFLGRTVREAWKFLLSSIVFGATIVTGTGFLGEMLKIDQFLPKSLVNSVYGSYDYKMTQIFDNPGPVWTYLAPGLAITLWLSLSMRDLYRRILAIALSCFFTLGILATGQRGGFLLCLLYLTICSIYSSIKGWKKRNFPILMIGGVILAGVGSSVYSLVRNPLLISETAGKIGYSWKSAPMFFDDMRYKLWVAAWNIFRESPLLGHGYASWFQLNSQAFKSNSSIGVFHSAHNWFVQLPVEFGLCHSTIFFSIILLIFLVALRCQDTASKKILVILLTIAFIVPSFLGNLDDIRPVFYAHIISWATLLGKYSDRNLEAKNAYKFIHKNEKIRIYNIFNKKVILIVPIMAALIIIFCFLNFTWGGSAFEANLAQPSRSVFRWLGQSANIATFRTAENRAYSLSELQPFEKPIAVRFKDLQIDVNSDESISLALENGSKWLPKRHPVSFSKGMPDTARWISAGINYPFIQSNLAISWSKSLFWWEDFGGTLGRWCGKECWFLAKSCGHRDRLDFSLFAPRKDLTAATPLSIEVTTYPLPTGGTFSSQTLASLPQPLAQQQFQLQNPEERLSVGVEGKRDLAWYLVRVGTRSTLNPKTSGLSEDNRDLGVVVGEAVCSNN